MLIGIDPLLTGPILASLDALGHHDRVLIADGNFPAHSLPRAIAVHSIGADAVAAIAAVLSVLPLETSDPHALIGRRSFDDETLEPMQTRVQGIAAAVGAPRLSLPPRSEFRAAVELASVVIRTTDFEPACFLLHRGVVVR